VLLTSPCPGGDLISAEAWEVGLQARDAIVAAGTFAPVLDPILILPGQTATRLFLFGPQDRLVDPALLAGEPLTLAPPAGAGPVTELELTGGESDSGGELRPVAAPDVDLAFHALMWRARHDEEEVATRLAGNWAPELSAKRLGIEAEGKTWSHQDIWDEFWWYRERYPNALLVYSDKWGSVGSDDLWLTFSGDVFYDEEGDEAVQWCKDEGWEPGQCIPLRLGTSPPGEGRTARHWTVEALASARIAGPGGGPVVVLEAWGGRA
jgi:hypothetical protein